MKIFSWVVLAGAAVACTPSSSGGGNAGTTPDTNGGGNDASVTDGGNVSGDGGTSGGGGSTTDAGGADGGVASDAGTVGNGTVGAACTADGQCTASGQSSRCLTDGFPGGACTATCKAAADCPGGNASCMMVNAATGKTCVSKCATSADCRQGYFCSTSAAVPGCIPRCDVEADPEQTCKDRYGSATTCKGTTDGDCNFTPGTRNEGESCDASLTLTALHCGSLFSCLFTRRDAQTQLLVGFCSKIPCKDGDCGNPSGTSGKCVTKNGNSGCFYHCTTNCPNGTTCTQPTANRADDVCMP